MGIGSTKPAVSISHPTHLRAPSPYISLETWLSIIIPRQHLHQHISMVTSRTIPGYRALLQHPLHMTNERQTQATPFTWGHCLSLPAGKTTRTTSKEFSGTLPFPFPWQVNQLCRDSFMHPLLGLRVRFNTLSPKLNTDMGDGLMKR